MTQRSSVADEFSAGLELVRLLANPLYLGAGVPRGDGRQVLVLPGLFANDAYLTPFHGFLVNIGYRPVISRISVNVGCADRLTSALRASLARETKPFAIIGHSRGGILGWSLAAEFAERVTNLILVGSPAPAVARAIRAGGQGGLATNWMRRASDRIRARTDPGCDFPACSCAFTAAMRKPLHPKTRLLSIWSAGDPIVPADTARLPTGPNYVVRGSHSGLIYNLDVCRKIAEELATPR